MRFRLRAEPRFGSDITGNELALQLPRAVGRRDGHGHAPVTLELAGHSGHSGQSIVSCTGHSGIFSSSFVRSVMAYLACTWPACVLALPRVAVAASDKGRSPGSPVTASRKNRALYSTTGSQTPCCLSASNSAPSISGKRLEGSWNARTRSGIGGEPQCRGHYDHRDRACPGPVAGPSGHSDRPILG